MKKIIMHDEASFAALRKLISPIHEYNLPLYEKLLKNINNCSDTLENTLYSLQFPDDCYETACNKKHIKENTFLELNLSWDDTQKTSLFFFFTLVHEEKRTKAAFNGGVIFHGWSKIFDQKEDTLTLNIERLKTLKEEDATISMHT